MKSAIPAKDGDRIARDEKGKKRQLTGIAFSRNKAPTARKAISSNDYATNFIEFLKQAPRNRPWSFWFGTTEPHRGYEYGSGVKAGKNCRTSTKFPLLAGQRNGPQRHARLRG